MALKLKLKMSGNNSGNSQGSPSSPDPPQPALPKLKIRPPTKKTSKESQDDETRPRKKHKIKLNLGGPKVSSSTAEPTQEPPVNLIQPQPAKTPRFRIKPTRIPGEGYDSEAPNIEDDPIIEQGIVIRFMNDANLDFVHQATDSGDLSGINIKWITREKAVVNVNRSLYSARLIDLPTITEIYKTVDKKNIFKTLDVCQILLALHPITNPTELNIETDFEVPPEYLYTHPLYKLTPNSEVKQRRTVLNSGLVSPYEGVYRRFRPRKASHRVMEDIEHKVDQLIKLDDEAEESHFELVDLSKSQNRFGVSRTPSAAPTPTATPSFVGPAEDDSHVAGGDGEVENEEEDGEVEFNAEDVESNLEEELNKLLGPEDEFNDETAEMLFANGGGDVGENLMSGDIGETGGEEEEEEEEEDDDDDDDDDEEEDEEDDDSKQGRKHVKLLEEEIAELENVVEYHRKNLATATSKMMRMKFQNTYNSLKSSLDQKKRSLSKHLDEQENMQRKLDPAHGLQNAQNTNKHEESEDDEDDEEGVEKPNDNDNKEDQEEEEEEGNDDFIDDLF